MLTTIPIHLIEPWPGLNPRKRFDPERQAELVESVKKHGILQPIVVHIRGDEWTEGALYWIIAGERRYRAALEVGLKDVPVRAGTFSEQEAVQLALIENLQRADMTVVEEARGYQRALESGMTQAELATQLGIAQPTIANRIRLLQLPDEVLELIEDGVILASHARDFLLPFTAVPEAARSKMFAEIVRLLGNATESPVPAPALERVVATAAVMVSRPIRQRDAIYSVDRITPLFDTPETPGGNHAKCGCRGPKFRYAPYGGPLTVRCFDPEWWDAAQAAAKAEEEAKRAALRKEAATEPGEAWGVPVIPESEFRQTHEWDDYVSLITPWYKPALVDVDQVPKESLVLLSGGRGGGRPQLVSTDVDAANRAIAAAEKEKKRRVAEERAKVVAAELEEMERREIEPWMLQRMMVQRPDSGAIVSALRDLGIAAKHGTGYDQVNSLSVKNVERLFRLLAIRARDGRLAYQDPIEARVEKEMRAELEPKLLALLPAVEAEADEDLDDGEELTTEAATVAAH